MKYSIFLFLSLMLFGCNIFKKQSNKSPYTFEWKTDSTDFPKPFWSNWSDSLIQATLDSYKWLDSLNPPIVYEFNCQGNWGDSVVSNAITTTDSFVITAFASWGETRKPNPFIMVDYINLPSDSTSALRIRYNLHVYTDSELDKLIAASNTYVKVQGGRLIPVVHDLDFGSAFFKKGCNPILVTDIHIRHHLTLVLDSYNRKVHYFNIEL